MKRILLPLFALAFLASASPCEDKPAALKVHLIGVGDYEKPFKAVAAKDQDKHPVLQGVKPITSRGYYNNGKLAKDAVVLQVVESDKKTPLPVTWVHAYKGGRTLYTSMGVPEDFEDE